MYKDVKNKAFAHLDAGETSQLAPRLLANRSKWFSHGLGVLFFLFSMFFFPKLANAATIYLSPASGNFGVGSTFNVSVLINTQGAAVNTAEATVTYSGNVELVSVRQGSSFYLTSPGSPSKGQGSVYFGGGLPTPGYSGNGGALGSMTFRARAEGSATIAIESGKVLLNDGLGTNAFNGSAGARITITPPPVAGVIVTSTTNPDQDTWYAKSEVALSWNRPNGAYGYSFEFDQNPNTVPDNTLDTTVTTTKSYSDVKDGVWYFHIRARPQSPTAGFGVTTHFKVQIDTQAPKSFDVTVAQSTLTFEAADEGSGIGRYEVAADDQVLADDARSPYTLSGLKNGTHNVTVKAFDKAGNNKVAQASVTIQGAAAPGFLERTIEVPLYLLLLVNLLILILITVIIWLIFKRRTRRSDKLYGIAQLEEELKEETQAAVAVSKKISSTKRKIDSKLKNLKK